MRAYVLKFSQVYDPDDTNVFDRTNPCYYMSINNVYIASSVNAAKSFIHGITEAGLDTFMFTHGSIKVDVYNLSPVHTIIQFGTDYSVTDCHYVIYTQDEFENVVLNWDSSTCIFTHECLTDANKDDIDVALCDLYLGYDKKFVGYDYDKDLHSFYYVNV